MLKKIGVYAFLILAAFLHVCQRNKHECGNPDRPAETAAGLHAFPQLFHSRGKDGYFQGCFQHAVYLCRVHSAGPDALFRCRIRACQV